MNIEQLRKDFEKMMDKYEAFGKMIIRQADMVRISDQNTELMALTKNFVDKCLAKAKVQHITTAWTRQAKKAPAGQAHIKRPSIITAILMMPHKDL